MGRNRAGDQPVRVPTDTRFGQRKQLEAAQGAIPLPDNQTPTPTPTQGAPAQGMPQSSVNVFGSSQRPSEPLTAGAPIGPGPSGPEDLPQDELEFLRAVRFRFPGPGLNRLIEFAGARR